MMSYFPGPLSLYAMQEGYAAYACAIYNLHLEVVWQLRSGRGENSANLVPLTPLCSALFA